MSLGDLVIKLRGGNLGEELPRLNVIPDVDIALGDVAADAGHDIGCLERVGRGGEQSHHHAVSGANRRYPHGGDDAAALL